MSKIFAGLLCVCVLSFVAGCQSDDKPMNDKPMSGSDTSMKSSTAAGDVCPHCAGKQTATAAGTCPVCGMKVSANGSMSPAPMKSGTGGATTRPATRPAAGTGAGTGADACAHCADVQTAKPDGTCPVCGMKVKS